MLQGRCYSRTIFNNLHLTPKLALCPSLRRSFKPSRSIRETRRLPKQWNILQTSLGCGSPAVGRPACTRLLVNTRENSIVLFLHRGRELLKRQLIKPREERKGKTKYTTTATKDTSLNTTCQTLSLLIKAVLE